MRVRCRLTLSLLIVLSATCPRALALLTFNDGKDLVFVNATYTFGFDSNIFTRAVATSSATQNFTFGATYSRKAGLIGVNAGLGWNFGDFSQVKGQNFADPSYSLTFTKGTGRTTGSLSFSAQKTDVPDPNANNRAVAWDYSSALSLRYPVNDRYYVTNSTSYASTLYTNRALFTDLGSLSDGIDLNYVFDSKLDFSGGYTFGLSKTTDTTDYDHSFTVGASGSLLPKLTGSFDIGYEERLSDYLDSTQAYGSITAGGSLSWRYSRELSFSSAISRGFSTSSTDVNINTTNVALTTDVNAIRRLRTNFVVSYTETAFLGVLGAGRRDTLWEFVANLGTAITTHVRANLAYAYMINYSNLGSAEFTRQTLSLTLSADY